MQCFVQLCFVGRVTLQTTKPLDLRQVRPTMEQYELDTFGRSHDIMSNFWNSCFDDLMSTAFRRDKDRSDSKSKFQVRHILCNRHFHMTVGRNTSVVL